MCPRQPLSYLSLLHTFVIVPGEEMGGRTGPGKQGSMYLGCFVNHSIICCGLVALRHPPGKQNKQESILQLLPPRSAFLLPRAKKSLVSSGFCCWFGLQCHLLTCEVEGILVQSVQVEVAPGPFDGAPEASSLHMDRQPRLKRWSSSQSQEISSGSG